MSETVAKRGRGRPRNPVVEVMFTLTGADHRDVKQLQVKARKLGGKVLSAKNLLTAMSVHFTRKGSGLAVTNFVRAAQASKMVSDLKRHTINPYTFVPGK